MRCSKRVQCGTLSDVRAVCCFVFGVCVAFFFFFRFWLRLVWSAGRRREHEVHIRTHSRMCLRFIIFNSSRVLVMDHRWAIERSYELRYAGEKMTDWHYMQRTSARGERIVICGRFIDLFAYFRT